MKEDLEQMTFDFDFKDKYGLSVEEPKPKYLDIGHLINHPLMCVHYMLERTIEGYDIIHENEHCIGFEGCDDYVPQYKLWVVEQELLKGIGDDYIE